MIKVFEIKTSSVLASREGKTHAVLYNYVRNFGGIHFSEFLQIQYVAVDPQTLRLAKFQNTV